MRGKEVKKKKKRHKLIYSALHQLKGNTDLTFLQPYHMAIALNKLCHSQDR